jgi:hypothetical protein
MLFFLFLFISGVSAEKSNIEYSFQKRVVYGEDNRIEVSELDLRYLSLPQAVAGIFWKDDVIENDDRNYTIEQKSYTCPLRLPWCDSERFVDQKIGPWCSSFLVGPRLIASAGHCVEEPSRLRFVFGYTGKERALRRDVYDCSKILVKVNTRTADYALFELDREVTGRIPLNISTPSPGEGLVMVGFPMGLPMKADFGQVRGMSEFLLVADLDAFSGNSGSLVASNKTLNVVGILIAGNQDFQIDLSGCCKTKKCSSLGCLGTWEILTKASLLLPFL